jgi:hypothetical protein
MNCQVLTVLFTSLLQPEPVFFRGIAGVLTHGNRRAERERRTNEPEQKGQTKCFDQQKHDEFDSHVIAPNAKLTDDEERAKDNRIGTCG